MICWTMERDLNVGVIVVAAAAAVAIEVGVVISAVVVGMDACAGTKVDRLALSREGEP